LALRLIRQQLLQSHLEKGFPPMLKYYIKSTEAIKRLRADQAGVVSFEYIIVAACIIGAVAAAFGTGATGAIGTALSGGIKSIVATFNAAV